MTRWTVGRRMLLWLRVGNVPVSVAVGVLSGLVTQTWTWPVVVALASFTCYGAAVELLTGLARGAEDSGAGRTWSLVPEPEPLPGSVEQFVGREWLTAQVDQVLRDANRRSGYVLIVADAGLGKTAYATHLAHARGWPRHITSRHGADPATTLGNLGEQLRRLKGLSGLPIAPDELPKARLWFAHVLQAAADAHRPAEARAEARPEPVVLVVDGLDEEKREAADPPLGLPTELPDGVFIIATCRSGTPLHALRLSPRTKSVEIRIQADSTENRTDVTTYLTTVTASAPLATVLQAANVDPVEFVAMLAERSGGVWIYLRYVLDEILSGERSPSTVATLPPRLGAYYAVTLARFRGEREWTSLRAPVMATLAAAREPLPVELVASLAGVPDTQAVIAWTDGEMRPFLATVDGNRSLRHESLREFLRGTADDSSLDAGLAQELAFAYRRAHVRIADSVLDRWGGLDAGLPVLADDPATAELVDGYARRWLVEHLRQAGRDGDIHRLLALESGPPAELSGGPRHNLWYLVQDAVAGGLDHFRADVARARRIAEDAVDAAVGASAPAPSIAEEIRYRLILASVASVAAKVPPALVKRLVEAGYWQPERALAQLATIPDPYDRVAAHLVVLPAVPYQRDVWQRCLDLVLALPDTIPQSMLPKLAAICPPEFVEHLAAAVRSFPYPGARAGALGQLAGVCPPGLRVDLFSDALDAIDPSTFSVYALGGIARHCPRELFDRAYRVAQAIPDDRDRVATMAGLIGTLSPDEAEPALRTPLDELASAPVPEAERAVALGRMAKALPDPLRTDVMVDALESAGKVTDRSLGWALVEIAVACPDEFVRLAPASALARHPDVVRMVAERSHPAGELAKELLRRAGNRPRGSLDSLRFSENDDLSEVLAVASPGELADRLAAIAQQMHWHDAIRWLATVSYRLPVDHRRAVFETALTKAEEAGIAHEVTELAEYCPAEFLRRLLGTVWTINDRGRRDSAMGALVARCPADRTAEATGHVDTAVSRDNPPADRARALLANAERNPDESVDILREIARTCPPDLVPATAAVARRVTDIVRRVEILGVLSCRGGTARHNEILAGAVQAIDDIHEPERRATAMARLVSVLPPENRTALFTQALNLAEAALRGDYPENFLLPLADSCPPAHREGMLRFGRMRFLSHYVRARVLAKVARQCPAHQQERLCDEVLTVFRKAYEEARRIHVPSRAEVLLVQLAADGPGHCRDMFLREGLRLLTGHPFVIMDDYEEYVLTRLAERLPPDVLGDLFAAVDKVVPGEPHQARFWAAVVGRLPDLDCAEAERIRLLRSALSRHRRGDMLAVLAAAVDFVADAGGADTACQVADAVRDVGRWWP